jgi:hypothetical protein
MTCNLRGVWKEWSVVAAFLLCSRGSSLPENEGLRMRIAY